MPDRTPTDTAAAIQSLIESARLYGLDTQANLRHALEGVTDDPVNRMANLLPWNNTGLHARLNQRLTA